MGNIKANVKIKKKEQLEQENVEAEKIAKEPSLKKQIEAQATALEELIVLMTGGQ